MKVDALIPNLGPDDYEKDEKQRTVALTEQGAQRMEELLIEAGLLPEGGLYDIHSISLEHHSNQALRAHKLCQPDNEYIVTDTKDMLIDGFAGRMKEGGNNLGGWHRWGERGGGKEGCRRGRSRWWR